MTLMAHLNFELYQINIKVTFLNGELGETIYMVQSPQFETEDYKNMVVN
jgi:hypothetical protein